MKKVQECHAATKQISRALLDMPLKLDIDIEECRTESEDEKISSAEELVKLFVEQLEQLDIIANEIYP